MSEQSNFVRIGDDDLRRTRIVVTFDAPMRHLGQVSRTLSALDELWCVSVETALIGRALTAPRAYPNPYPWPDVPYGYFDEAPLRQRLDSIPRPESVKVSLASPLLVELAGQLGWPVVMATSAGLLRYLIKNADAVGAFIPRLIESWFNGWVDVHGAHERWRARSLPSPRALDDLAATAQQAGQIVADAQPREPEVSGPGEPWTPPWPEEGRQQ